MIAENRFLDLLWLEAMKFRFDKKYLQMHCNFKFWFHSNIFLVAGYNRSWVTQKIKIVHTRKRQDAIIIRRRNLIHWTPFKKSGLHCVILSIAWTTKKNDVALNVVHRWLINDLSLWNARQMPSMHVWLQKLNTEHLKCDPIHDWCIF